MNGDTFLAELNIAVEEIWPSGTGDTWTQGIYAVLKQVGKRNNFIVRCEGSEEGGELYNLDFIYFSNRERVAGKDNWASPAVVIEHENEYRFEATAVDFWKLCHFVAPLRVMIGYQRTEQEALRVGEMLIARYDDWQWRQAADAETVLLMGWHQSSRPRQWFLWRKRGDADEWTRPLPR